MKGYAGAVWDRLAPKLYERGQLEYRDRDLFANYCILVAYFKETIENGRINERAELARQLRILRGEFGLSPAARTKINTASK